MPAVRRGGRAAGPSSALPPPPGRAMTAARPWMPADIKRAVRQRCGYGCVRCGLPLYDYDHLEGYANLPRHVASELTLLCPNCHDQKTKGLLPNEAVRRANDDPLNRRTG